MEEAQEIINDSYKALSYEEYNNLVEEVSPIHLSKIGKGDYKK